MEEVSVQFDDDMKSRHKGMFVAVRRLLLSFDGITEMKKDRVTTYSLRNGGVSHLRTMAMASISESSKGLGWRMCPVR